MIVTILTAWVALNVGVLIGASLAACSCRT
jgi:hypothetical protein